MSSKSYVDASNHANQANIQGQVANQGDGNTITYTDAGTVAAAQAIAGDALTASQTLGSNAYSAFGDWMKATTQASNQLLGNVLQTVSSSNKDVLNQLANVQGSAVDSINSAYRTNLGQGVDFTSLSKYAALGVALVVVAIVFVSYKK